MKHVLWCLCLLLCLPHTVMAKASASLDRTQVMMGESVRLVVQLDEAGEADLSPLYQDFEVLQQNQSSTTKIHNMTMSRHYQWIFELMPKHSGKLVIPVLRFGQQQTQALSLDVLDASATTPATTSTPVKDVMLLSSVSSHDVYVQAQLILTVKLLSMVNLSQVSISEPNMPHVLMKRLGKDRQYEMVYKQRRFVVLEQQYALFPQQSGLLVIPALQLNARKSSGQSMFRATGAAIRQFSQALEVHVLPKPKTWQHPFWLPASDLSIREIWTDRQTQFKVGESFTRTIEITAQGLMAEQLPTWLRQSSHADFKQYPDQPTLTTTSQKDGVVGIRLEKIALIPMKSGEMRLTGFTLHWWNTRTQTMQSVQIPERIISVLPADKQLHQTMPTPPLPHETSILRQNDAMAVAVEPPTLIVWQGLTLFFALAWLFTLLALWQIKKRQQQHRMMQQEQGKQRQMKQEKLWQKLHDACLRHDVEMVVELLPMWGRYLLADESIQHFSQLKGYQDELDRVLLDLEVFLYGQAEQQAWSGDILSHVLASLKTKKIAAEQQSVLKEMYL